MGTFVEVCPCVHLALKGLIIIAIDIIFASCQIEVLPEIVSAVQGTGVEVYMDSGVRLGTDVLKALALGARAVFVGRPAIWGLAYKVQCTL